MNKILFYIGDKPIYSYGFAIMLGYITCAIILMILSKDKELESDDIVSICAVSWVTGWAGGKILYLIVYNIIGRQDNTEIVSGTGFVVIGGIILGIISNIILSKIRHKSIAKYLDTAVTGTAIVQSFGRLGCYLNGCCYGKITSGGLYITDINGINRIPTQLISSGLLLILSAVLIYTIIKKYKDGTQTRIYIISYCVGRCIIELFRGDIRGNIGFLSTSQFICIIVLTIYMVYIIAKQLYHKLKR